MPEPAPQHGTVSLILRKNEYKLAQRHEGQVRIDKIEQPGSSTRHSNAAYSTICTCHPSHSFDYKTHAFVVFVNSHGIVIKEMEGPFSGFWRLDSKVRSGRDFTIMRDLINSKLRAKIDEQIAKGGLWVQPHSTTDASPTVFAIDFVNIGQSKPYGSTDRTPIRIPQSQMQSMISRSNVISTHTMLDLAPPAQTLLGTHPAHGRLSEASKNGSGAREFDMLQIFINRSPAVSFKGDLVLS